ncbi:hypothetical protein BV898_11986 [Hypsibius exemplaris]|uniref:Uncharacterized protein n=1 Tax=Hypsibius exemplaris TaxID=2072580 RepID=A0A1W0WEY4_HYPEX|nr:hypothetical protein BV898_11986 [Hypsibius exemplaris]
MDSDNFFGDPRIICVLEALQRFMKQEGREDLLPHRTVFDDGLEDVIADRLNDEVYGQQCDDEDNRDLSNDVLELVAQDNDAGSTLA